MIADKLAEALRLVLEFERGEHGEPGVIGCRAIEDAEIALAEYDAQEDQTPRAVMIKGNPVDGFTFVGPFLNQQEVVDHYGDTVDTEWWTAELIPPDEH